MPSAPLQLTLRRSWRLAGFVAVTHLAAFSVLWFLSLPLWLAVLLAALIAVSAWREIAQALLLGQGSVHRLIWTADGVWQVFDGKGRERRLDLGYSFAEPWLITLCLRASAPRQRLCLAFLPDALSEDAMHALRLRLRMAQRPGARTGPGAVG